MNTQKINDWIMGIVLVLSGLAVGLLVTNDVSLAPEPPGRELVSYDSLRYDVDRFERLAQRGRANFEFGGEVIPLENLKRVSVYADGRPTQAALYSGKVGDSLDSEVRLAFLDSGIIGYIREGENWLFVEPEVMGVAAQSAGFLGNGKDFLGRTRHKVFTNKDVAFTIQGECDSVDSGGNPLCVLTMGDRKNADTVQLAPPCSETDNGDDKFTFGTLISQNGITRKDSCSENILTEYYCVQDTNRQRFRDFAIKKYDCANGCSNGACLQDGGTPTPPEQPQPPTCTPKTCNELGKQCGNSDNGCGQTISCGTCNAGQQCNTNGQCTNNEDGGNKKILEMALDTDYEYYLRYGSESAANVEAIIHAVNGIYEPQLNIEIRIVNLHVSIDRADHFSGEDAGTRLVEFHHYYGLRKTGLERDVAHLFSGVDLTGNVIGVAFLSAACKSFGYGLSQDLEKHPALMPILVAHEVGHNLGSLHDPCVQFGIDPETGRETCVDYGEKYIMLPGLFPDHTDRFSEGSKQQIAEFVSSVSCLDTIGNPEDPTCTPNCDGKQCGSDSCGGSCGTCNAGQSCTTNGQCEQQPGCFDSDNGNNPKTKGTTTDDTGSKTDSCTIFNRFLKEYYCQNDKIVTDTQICMKGCSNGACR